MKPEQEYNKLRKKHKKLPTWKWINENFDVREDGKFTTSLRKAMHDRLNAITRNIIEPLITSSENYCCWFERKFVTKADKDKLFDNYRALQTLMWNEQANSIDGNEKDLVKWIIEVRKEWDEMMPKVARICNKVSDGWKHYKKEKKETAYHG